MSAKADGRAAGGAAADGRAADGRAADGRAAGDSGGSGNSVDAVDGAAIETRELRKEFGKIVALAGLTMTVPRGQVFGFLGPNGDGKTKAVKLILGLTP